MEGLFENTTPERVTLPAHISSTYDKENIYSCRTRYSIVTVHLYIFRKIMF